MKLESSFLFTRVIEPDTNDCNNMEIILKYIQVNIGLTLILSIDRYENIKWYIDAALAVHRNTLIHIDS